jgi:SAM-dependent methyltransferase
MLRSMLAWSAQVVYQVSAIGISKEYTFSRYGMYKRLEHIGRSLEVKTGSVLSISHSRHLAGVMGITATNVVEANYPEVSILDLPYPEGSFDFVLSDQVFEHIEGNPQRAIDESLRVLKPGGVLVHTTCFLTPYHGPGDFWRYTPEGLSLLCRSASRVISSEGWGHPLVPLLSFLNFTHTPVVTAAWHPMNWLARYRHASYDSLVWVVAQK